MDEISEYVSNDMYEKICKKYNIPIIYRSELDNKELFWCKIDKIAKAFPKMDILDSEILLRIYGGIRYSNKIRYILQQWEMISR